MIWCRDGPKRRSSFNSSSSSSSSGGGGGGGGGGGSGAGRATPRKMETLLSEAQGHDLRRGPQHAAPRKMETLLSELPEGMATATACAQCKGHLGYVLSFGHQLSGNAWDVASWRRPVRERGPSTMLFSTHWSPRLSESAFRIDRIKYYKRPSGVKNRKWCFRVWPLTKTCTDQKSKIFLESRR